MRRRHADCEPARPNEITPWRHGPNSWNALGVRTRGARPLRFSKWRQFR